MSVLFRKSVSSRTYLRKPAIYGFFPAFFSLLYASLPSLTLLHFRPASVFVLVSCRVRPWHDPHKGSAMPRRPINQRENTVLSAPPFTVYRTLLYFSHRNRIALIMRCTTKVCYSLDNRCSIRAATAKSLKRKVEPIGPTVTTCRRGCGVHRALLCSGARYIRLQAIPHAAPYARITQKGKKVQLRTWTHKGTGR